MHKPFDFEAAKAGQAVEYHGFSGWELCRFLGESSSSSNYFVIERIKDRVFQLVYAVPTDLRMAPKKETVRYRLCAFRNSDGSLRPGVTDSESRSDWLENREEDFVCWLTEWQEVEIPQ